MGSVGNPNRFGPYSCAQPVCTVYCPQWCYFAFPPPQPSPSPFFSGPGASSDLNSSRPFIMIAVVGILASIMLLMTIVYIIISKCFTNNIQTSMFDGHAITEQELAAASSSSSSGLDEASIKLIKVCKYTKEDVRDCSCSVCLSEFEEGDSLRLLPRCDHAFHIPCIDTWLASHSNCPLCRADVVIAAADDDDDSVNMIKPVSLLLPV